MSSWSPMEPFDFSGPARTGGGGSPAATSMPPMEAPSAGESTADMLKAYFKWNPKMAEQIFGLTQQYQPQYADLTQGLVSGERAADLADVAKLAPQLQGIREAGEAPEVTSMRNMLLSQIAKELAMGEKLTPEQSLAANENLRSAEVARGFGLGQGSANREAVQRTLQGMQLLEQRQNKASNMIAKERAEAPDPFLTILGRPSAATSSAIQQTAANTSQPSLSFLGNNYWNAQNAQTEAQKYNLQLKLAQQNPYLYGGGGGGGDSSFQIPLYPFAL